MIDLLCDSNATSLVPLLLAVWSIILHRFADTEQLYFGVNVPKAPESPIRSIFDGDAIFTASLDAKTPIKQLLHVSSHNVCPLASDKPRSIRFNTGIQFVMGDRHGASSQKHIQGHSSCGTDTKGCDIVLFAEKSSEARKLLLQYNNSILSPSQARAVAGAVTQALCSFRDDPAQSVKDVCLVDQKSWDDIVLWNSRPRDFPYNRSIAEVISARSQSQPGAQAVFSWDGTLTYEQLEVYSSRVAGYLKELGVGANGMVPLCFDRSIWAIVATLAVLKTGAAIIPMDASHPVVRLKQIVAQVKATIILVSECYATLLADTVDRVVSVSWSMVTGLSQYDNSTVHWHPRPQDVAYIIFTSGSTGNPKGCVVEHRALAGVEEHAEALRLTSDSRVLQFASYSFGVSLIEILCTLTAGGTICIPSKDERLNDLSGTIRRMMVNWAWLTPSLVSSMDPGSSIDSGLRTMVLAGEPLSKHNLREWAAKVCLIQVYGFNEAFGPCTIQVGITPTRSPHNIGTSSHAKLWLVSLDNHNVLAPIGALAELVVEGGFLARGNLDDEERTEAAFIENPVWLKGLRRDTKSRFYKTGDLVRYDLDGSIIHMGRKATHAKINGQRVELGEVEHHVHQHFDWATKTVAEAVTPAGSSGVPFLAVFVYCEKREATSQEGTNSSILVEADESFQQSSANTDSIIRGLLPEYMVPRLYLPLGRVPMTVSGKVDRRKLRDIVAETSHEALMLYAEPRPTIAAPTSELEKRLHELFAQVLCVREDAFGVDTSFFHLGGDSLKAMRISRRALEDGLPLTVENIFRQKTISCLASSLNDRDGGLLSSLATYASPQTFQPLSLVHQDISFTDLSLSSELIEPSNVVDVIPATESQVWFLTHWSSTFSSFLLRGQIDISRLQYALGQLVEKHASLRTVFCEHHGNILQVVLKRSLPCFEHIHTDGSLESAFSAVSDRESSHPSLSNQPFKVMLVSRSDEEHLLAIRLSHAQYDWYSLSIVLRDLASAYNNHSLPVSTTVSFPDYVYFCHQHPSEHANRFWSELLHGSHVTRIPLPSTNETDDTISIRESASTTLPRLPQDTTYSILVNAAVSLILSKLMDSSDVVFGLVVNTRSLSMQGIDSIVGPCINILPLRIVLQKDQSASDLCTNVREAYANISQHCHLEPSDITGPTNISGAVKAALPFGCIVNHFSVDESWEPLPLEGLSCLSFSTTSRTTLPNQVIIRSIIQGNTLCIEVLMSTGEGARGCSSKFASCLARAVLCTVEQLSKKFASPLSSMDIDLDGL